LISIQVRSTVASVGNSLSVNAESATGSQS